METLYEKDFNAWLQQQVTLLRLEKFMELDTGNLIEELESMSKSEQRELVNRLAVLLAHMLKLVHQPERRSRSWIATIVTQRNSVQLLLEQSPSLQYDIEKRLSIAYITAKRIVAAETGLNIKTFPELCPWTLQQILDNDFLPN